jgi:hypothetical protein
MSRNKPRHGHQHTISDYESDVNYLSDIPAPPAERTDEELNLAVLRRHNHDVFTLEYVAPYVVVYIFNPTSQEWEKSGIEGTAFVCGLVPNNEYSARYAVMVLNRRGLENFNLELLSEEEVEITDEYIILQSPDANMPHVYGLWVFSEPPPSSTAHHRVAISQKIKDCAQRVAEGRRSNQHQDTQIEDGAAMGRQLSLQQIFGQQRQEDDAWSVRSHSPAHHSPQPPPITQFTTPADTAFFLSSKRPAAPVSPAVSAQSTGQSDVLLDLFRKAGDGYRGAL